FRRGGFDGLGFMLGDGFAGIDLDDVRNPTTGALTPEADELVKRCATYCEVSPSETGVKLFGRGVWSDDWNRKPFPGGGEIEGYSTGRYFTVTGRPVAAYPVADIQAHINELAVRFGSAKPTPKKPSSEAESVHRQPHLNTDRELI